MPITTFKLPGTHPPVYTVFDKQQRVCEYPTLWLNHIRKQIGINVSHQSLIHYAKVIKYFLESLTDLFDNRIFTLDEMILYATEEHITSIMQKYNHLSRSTLNNRDLILIKFYKWLEEDALRQGIPDFRSPYSGGFKSLVRGRIVDNPCKYITSEEIIAMINCLLTEEAKVFCLFLLASGLRIGEAEGLILKDLPKIDLTCQPEYITFPVLRGGKGPGGRAKPRDTIIASPVYSRILNYHVTDEYRFAPGWPVSSPTKPLFLTINGRPQRRENISKKMKAAAKRAGLDPSKFHPHAFRHSFAMFILRSEFGDSYIDSLLHAMAFLGHNNPRTTSRYARIPLVIIDNFEKRQSEIVDNRFYEEMKHICMATI